MRGLVDIYATLFRTDLAVQFQYRAAMIIWLIGRVIEALVFLSVWTAVARSQGGQVGGFSVGDFAAYYITMMMMSHLTFTWFMFEFEFRVRSGSFSPLLLQPLHPIHRDIAMNISYKFMTLVVMLPTMFLMIWIFDPIFHTPTWAIWAAVPVVLLAFLMRFFIEWALALVALWTTRTAAANQIYFAAILFFSGQMAPLSLMPEWIQTLAAILPFRWMMAFPTELLLGRLTPDEVLWGMVVQVVWLGLAWGMMALTWTRGIKRYSAVGA
jgi:ABC-2 type transport system permease protein